MKNAIGIRVTPSVIYFTVVANEGENIEVQVIDKIVNPKALNTPEQLKYIRNTLSDIIHEFEVTHACIRATEPTAQKININRIYIEGVIQELFASSPIQSYFVGYISSISARLNINRNEFKGIADAKTPFLEIDNWGDFNKEERESFMSAVSSLEI